MKEGPENDTVRKNPAIHGSVWIDHVGGRGYPADQAAGFPNLRSSEARGEYRGRNDQGPE